MIKLPYCPYPNAANRQLHGLQPLPAAFPLLNLNRAEVYRSRRYSTITIDQLNHQQIVELTGVIARSFAQNEPMARHVNIPATIPPSLYQVKHTDAFGEENFGEWTKENILFWIIRLFALTGPSSKVDQIQMNEHVLSHSLAVTGDAGEIIGGALNLSLSQEDTDLPIRLNDPFIQALYPWFEPIHCLLKTQENIALQALCKQYSDFKASLQAGKVGNHFMVARSPLLPTEDAFELVAASVERLKQLGYDFVVTAAANQWTGAAFEVLGGIQVHFAPYRLEQQIVASAGHLPDSASSTDGFISDKDSGCMFYALRLR
jgi:hypothetical protein